MGSPKKPHDSPAGQNLYASQLFPCGIIYHLTVEIPKEILIDNCPAKIVMPNDLIRKTRTPNMTTLLRLLGPQGFIWELKKRQEKRLISLP